MAVSAAVLAVSAALDGFSVLFIPDHASDHETYYSN